MTSHSRLFYIGGQWVEPLGKLSHRVENPATGEAVGSITLACEDDVSRAVAAARAAFPAYSATSPQWRAGLLKRVVSLWKERAEELAMAMTMEMGSPITFSRNVQSPNALGQILSIIPVLESYAFEQLLGPTLIRREPIGVCGLITPWNWPLNQVTSKLAPALATGCTVVLKPSEVAPLSSVLLAEILHDAGFPPGVFNLVQGDGAVAGAAIARHPDIDMVSFTGSTRAGALVAQAAAPTVKRVALELGGKSPLIVLPDADLQEAVAFGVVRCFTNTGQSCIAPTRMLVHRSQLGHAEDLARTAADGVVVGEPTDPRTTMGPLASAAQFEKVQLLIAQGIDDGARLVAGGTGRPSGLSAGWFVRPTVFSDAHNDMSIAREEIFGPVLTMLSYETEEEAIAIANDTPYGLAGYVYTGDTERGRAVANRIRAGRIFINNPPADQGSPFGGYKRSGNGREQGLFGFEEYLETKAVLGISPPPGPQT